MSDVSAKDRLHRALDQAFRDLSSPVHPCIVTRLNNHVFHLEALRKKEVRRIRVVLDRITAEDERIVQASDLPDNFTKEIWMRPRGSKAFRIVQIP